MSQKRKHVEAGDTATDAPKGKKQRPFHARSRGPKKSNTAQSDSNTDSTGALKRRIRDLKRVLSHADNNATKKMPATVRIVQERELEACEHELAEKLAHKQETDFRTKIIGKYHHIRFFERQKATRTVKRLRKQLAELKDESEKAAMLKTIHNAEVDVNYTTHYPLLIPYVSLFPNKKEVGATADQPVPDAVGGPKGNVDMWKSVEKAIEAGTLEELRNSREGVTIPGPKDALFAYEKGRKTKKDHIREQKQDKALVPPPEDDESDGGFFE